MSSDSSTLLVTIVSSTPSQNLITINVAAHLPLKLISLNYFSWKAQFNALLFGLDLLGYLDGTLSCPFATVVQNDKTIPNLDYISWGHQDQLILHAIFASLNEAVIPLVSSAITS